MLIDALGGYSAATLLAAPKHEPLSLSLAGGGGARVRLTKAPGESVQHLLLKGMLWSLLLPTHPDAACEVDVGLRYRPDVVSLDGASGRPRWWGECGSVKASKLNELAAAFPDCRFSVAKWGRSDLTGYASQLRSGLALSSQRTAPFELIGFPADSAERFVADDGQLTVTFEDLQVVRL